METIPLEIIVHIVEFIENIHNVFSFITTCSTYYELRNVPKCLKKLYSHEKLSNEYKELLNAPPKDVFKIALKNAFKKFYFVYTDNIHISVDTKVLIRKIYFPLIYTIGKTLDCGRLYARHSHIYLSRFYYLYDRPHHIYRDSVVLNFDKQLVNIHSFSNCFVYVYNTKFEYNTNAIVKFT